MPSIVSNVSKGIVTFVTNLNDERFYIFSQPQCTISLFRSFGGEERMFDGNYKKIVWTLKVVLSVIICYELLEQSGLSVNVKAGLVGGLVFMLLNDFYRNRLRLSERHRMLYVCSLMANMVILSIYLVLLDSAATGVYYIFPIAEIFLTGRSILYSVVIVHVLVYLSAALIAKADLTETMLPYFAILLLVYLFRGISLEREKSELLHAELAEANAKLKEVIIVKERTRIAQEMHDSIGHTLIALRMQLEYAGNTFHNHPQLAEEALSKAQIFSQKSIKELRKAVAILKDPASSRIDLNELLTDMIESLQTSGTLSFTFTYDHEVEKENQDLKSCIYNSVREAVTNGLKHGKARHFLIEIKKRSESILVVVEDDGLGCNVVKKSHGLQGIEERIDLLNGSVEFSSEKGNGFRMCVEIPV